MSFCMFFYILGGFGVQRNGSDAGTRFITSYLHVRLSQHLFIYPTSSFVLVLLPHSLIFSHTNTPNTSQHPLPRDFAFVKLLRPP